MAAYTFTISFFLMFLTAAACWLLIFLTVPELKRTYPEQYMAAGSPSPWTSSLADLSFLCYLVRNQFHVLPDSRLVWRLKAIKFFWVGCFFCIAVMFGSLIAGIGA